MERWDNDVERDTYRKFIQIPDSEEFSVRATNVRLEKTGLHARVGLFLGEKYLGHDTFNMGRREDRTRLAKDAFSRLGDVSKVALPLIVMNEYLDGFSLELEDIFSKRYLGARIYGKRTDAARRFLLRPYILTGGGSILFAPPGTGKSWLALCMALSVENDLSALWPCERTTALYVNLERSEDSMMDRLAQAGEALAIHNPNLLMLNRRGASLTDVYESVLDMVLSNNVGLVVLDSLSRSGLGSMVFDDVSNKSMDLLNGLRCSWLAVGHTPRGDADHTYGSVMFDAAADLTLKLSAEQREHTLGLSLEVTKANDIAKPPRQFIALEFDGDKEHSELIAIRNARSNEFPELEIAGKGKVSDDVVAYLRKGKATATEIAKETGHNRVSVAKFLSKASDVARLGREGNEVFYGLKSQ